MDNKKFLIFSTVKDILFCILISLFCLIPVFKQIVPISDFADNSHYYYLLASGIFGFVCFATHLILEYKKCSNLEMFFNKNFPFVLLFLYLIWTLFSACMARDKNIAFNGSQYRKDGYLSYLAYAGYFGLAFCIKSKKIRKFLIYFFIATVILTAVFVIFQKNKILTNFIHSYSTETASFDNTNHYGYYLLIATALSSFLFIFEKNIIVKICNLLMYSFLLYTLIVNNTFGCYLAIISTFLFYLVFSFFSKQKKLPIIFIIIIFISISLLPKIMNRPNLKKITNSNIEKTITDIKTITTTNSTEPKWESAGSSRMKLWKYGVKAFLKNPIAGYGPENLLYEYFEVGIRSNDRPHNLLIQLATTSGLPGLLLYVSGVGLIILKGLKKSKANEDPHSIHNVFLFTSIAYLASSMFGNSMYYTSPYYFIVLGFLANELFNEDINSST